MNIIDFYAEQGSTFNQTVTLNTDLTGSTVTGIATDSIGGNVNGIASITDYINGSIKLEIVSGATQYMSAGTGHYQVELLDSNGVVTKPFKGRIYMDGELNG